MRIALIRREYITHLDGVNRFIALLAEGLAKLGHTSFIVSWCYRDTIREDLEEYFKEVHGLDSSIPIYTLKSKPCEGDPWLRIAWDWWTGGSRLLRRENVDIEAIRILRRKGYSIKLVVVGPH